MIGIRQFPAASRRCSSKPPIDGIRTSRIKQAVLRNWRDFKKSSAEGNPFALYPTDCMRLTIASTTDRSSSTTEISGTLIC